MIFPPQVLIILPCWLDKIFQFSGGSTAKIITSSRAITLDECKYMFIVLYSNAIVIFSALSLSS